VAGQSVDNRYFTSLANPYRMGLVSSGLIS
jgi:hypothetical protein